jgi:hypothetical protein
MRNITNNIAGLALIALLVGTSVVAWSRSTGSHETQYVNQVQAFSPDQMHRNLAAPLAAQNYHDMSFVYSAEQAPFVAP